MTFASPGASRPAVAAGDERIVRLYESALGTISRNVRTSAGGSRILCAGADYPTPWTRDAAINSWSAVSLIDPELAEATLREVTEAGEHGPVVQQDDQLWDQLVWAIGARCHVEATGDRRFARWAAGVVERTLALRSDSYRPGLGLYIGGALMQDGISGYPFPEVDRPGDSSFIGDYSEAREIAALSTNVIYAAACDAAVWLRHVAGGESEIAVEPARSARLRAAVRRAFRDPATGTWSYLVDEAGRRMGYQELLGLALLLEHGELSDTEAATLTEGVRRCPAGIPLVHPHFPRFDDTRPGRHNMMVWPMATGQWAVAAARRGAEAPFAASLEDLVSAVSTSDGAFFEVYDARDGSVSGGWQVGTMWPSVPDQTWSATAFLRCVHEGLLGMRASIDRMRFEPVLPPGIDHIGLTGLLWRGDELDVRVRGRGSTVVSATVDGERRDVADGPVTIAPRGGPRELRIELSPSGQA